MFNFTSDSSGDFDSQDRVVARCPVCDKGFHESVLARILQNPQPHGICKRCGAWLAILVNYTHLDWFLIGFGDRAIPIDGKGPPDIEGMG